MTRHEFPYIDQYLVKEACDRVWNALDSDDRETEMVNVGVKWLLDLNYAVAHLRAALSQSLVRKEIMDPQATAGRIVHYYAPQGSGAWAAIVNRDTGPNGFAQLTVFEPSGPTVRSVSYSEEPQPGCWSWMPYQKQKAASAEGNVSESAEPRPELPPSVPAQRAKP